MARSSASTAPARFSGRKSTGTKRRFVLCVANPGYAASLEVRKLYEYLQPLTNDPKSLIRIVDESGEDYLYPIEYFRPSCFRYPPSEPWPMEVLPPNERSDPGTVRHARGERHGGVRIRGGHLGPRDRRDGVVAVGVGLDPRRTMSPCANFR